MPKLYLMKNAIVPRNYKRFITTRQKIFFGITGRKIFINSIEILWIALHQEEDHL